MASDLEKREGKKAKGGLGQKCVVIDKEGRHASQHDSPSEAKSASRGQMGTVRYYGLDVTHRFDPEGKEVHNRYKEGSRPEAPSYQYSNFAFRK